jgi:hypothetical protein
MEVDFLHKAQLLQPGVGSAAVIYLSIGPGGLGGCLVGIVLRTSAAEKRR